MKKTYFINYFSKLKQPIPYKFILSICIIIVSIFSFTSKTQAEELSITDNGSGSQNIVTSQTSSNTQVQQSNTTSVQNTVQSSSNTGENNASDNTGGKTRIQTGDTDSATHISNDAINTNISKNQTCNCPNTSTDVKISGNGSNSQNTADVSQTTTHQINQTNSVSVTNTTHVNADTGNNTASNNSGTTLIETGAIHSNIDIQNSRINFSIDNQSETVSNQTIKIAGNGANSINDVVSHLNNSNQTFSSNFATIVNNAVQNLNTGSNFAQGNNGSVAITTGNILSSVNIVNEDINTNITNHTCACNVTPPGPEKPVSPVGGVPPQQPTPSTPSTAVGGGPGGGSGGSSGGSVLGTTTGILPVTGNYWLFIAFIGNSIMFFLGWYLRLRSGRSPGLRFAFS